MKQMCATLTCERSDVGVTASNIEYSQLYYSSFYWPRKKIFFFPAKEKKKARPEKSHKATRKEYRENFK
jgi:hypothetical protein